jgi:hypothetical protein
MAGVGRVVENAVTETFTWGAILFPGTAVDCKWPGQAHLVPPPLSTLLSCSARDMFGHFGPFVANLALQMDINPDTPLEPNRSNMSAT